MKYNIGFKPIRTPQEIIDQTNEIAKIIYRGLGHTCDDFIFYDGTHEHPQERGCWEMAKEIQDFMTATDVDDAMNEIDPDAN